MNNFKTRMHQLRLFLIAAVLAFATIAVPLHSTWIAAASDSKKKTVHVRSYNDRH